MYTDHNDRSKGHSLCYFSLASVFMSMGPKAVELKRSFDEEEDFAYEDYLKDASMKSRSKFHLLFLCALSVPIGILFFSISFYWSFV